MKKLFSKIFSRKKEIPEEISEELIKEKWNEAEEKLNMFTSDMLSKTCPVKVDGGKCDIDCVNFEKGYVYCLFVNIYHPIEGIWIKKPHCKLWSDT